MQLSFSAQNVLVGSVLLGAVGGTLGACLRNLNDILPPFFREELLDFCGVIREGGLRPEGKRGKKEEEKYWRRFHLASG